MGKKTRKNCKEVFIEDIFLDRDCARAAFWERFDAVKNDEEGNFQVIMYHGLGGMGKTSLLRQIEREIDEREEEIIWEHYDFNDGQDPVVVLRKIVKDLQSRCNFEFPLFLYAIYRYLLMCGENPDAPEVENLLDSVPGVRRAVKLANALPVVNVVSQPLEWLADALCDSFDALKKRKIKDQMNQIDRTAKEKLREGIPHIFVQELNANLERAGNPVFVLILDTYERLVNELSDVGTPLENDLWLRDDDDGILQQIGRMVCVLAGREMLKWRDIDKDWDEDVLRQVQIDVLDKDYSMLLLEKHGIVESDIKERIIDVTQGMPLYLDVCIDTYRGAKDRNIIISPALFDNKIERLAQRLLSYMSDEEKDVVCLLSCMGKWDDSDFFMINDELSQFAVSCATYEKVLHLTFVRREENGYFIHQTMQEILIQYCDEQKLYSYANAIYAYACRQNILSPKSYKFIYGISKICRNKEDEVLTRWWMAQISTTLKVYLDVFYLNQFLSIYELLKDFARDYRFKALYLSYLLKIADYEKASDFIRLNKPAIAESADELEFLFTASYYFFIKGIDSEALALREDVYKRRIRLLGDDDRDTIRTGLALASSYSRVGQHRKSIDLGVFCRKKLNGIMNGYDSTLSTANNQLGDSYFRLGDFEQALVVYREVYDLRIKFLGEENNSTMIAYNHMADCLVNLGKFDEALNIYRKVREIRDNILCVDTAYEYALDGEKYCSKDHPDTIIVDNNMAVCLIEMGKYESARELLKKVVAKRRQCLGVHAPATMGALENLAMCEHYCHNKEEAIRDITEVIEYLSRSFKDDHYDLVLAKYHQALIHEDADEVSKLIDKYRDALSYNLLYLKWMEEHRFIGYFSLGRYYE